jgi:inner membrane protein
MDSVTHIALGAIIGEGMRKKDESHKLLLWGTAVQFFPDVDVIAALWLSPVDNLLFHRGITHSLLACTTMPLLFAFIASRLRKENDRTFLKWSLFFFTQYASHLFVDLFNAYGVGLLEPFSSKKFSFHTIYVADPFFTVSLVIGVFALLFIRDFSSRKHVVTGALLISSFYLAYTWVNKFVVMSTVNERLESNNVVAKHLLTTPTQFNNWVWFVAAESDSGFYVGYASVFDTRHDEAFRFFPRKHKLLSRAKDAATVNDLISFSDGFYTVENKNDTLVFNDLRFGQIAGWFDPHASFVFHYYVDYPELNKTVMQRGRFSNWNQLTLKSLAQRAAGHH